MPEPHRPGTGACPLVWQTWTRDICAPCSPSRIGGFYAHGGADYRGLARAVVTSALAGRIVSGGSTPSMQTARLLEPRPDRTPQAKVLEILRAWQLERRFNKHEILDLYLVTAPFGGNIDGVAAAARLYFGKAPAELTWAESALLVALPQNPAGRRPDRFPQQAEAARNRVLDVLVEQQILSREEADRAKARTGPDPAAFHALPRANAGRPAVGSKRQ